MRLLPTAKRIFCFLLLGLVLSPLLGTANEDVRCPRPLDIIYASAVCIESPECSWGYNPPAYFSSDCPCKGFLDTLSFRLDFLWWRACEQGLALGEEDSLRTFTTSPTHAIVFERTRTKNPHFHFKPGFRLGVDHVSLCDCWDVGFEWTHFHSKASARGLSAQPLSIPGTTFLSYWDRGVNLFPDRAKGVWKLNLDLLDLSFGRKFYVSSCMVLRPHFGLRAVRIEQSYRVEASANRDLGPFNSQSNTFVSRSHATENLMGVGPRVGLEIEFALGCSIAAFGEASTSLVFGRFDRHSKEHCKQYTSLVVVQDPLDFFYKATSGFESCSRPISDLVIGLRWDGFIEWCNQSHPILVSLAWEQHTFYNLNDFNFGAAGIDMRTAEFYTAQEKYGDLNTQGLTLSSQVLF